MKFIFTFFYIFFFYNLTAQNVNVAWAKSIGSRQDDYCNSVVTDVFGNVYTTGFFTNTVDFDPGPGVFNLSVPSPIYSNIFITKMDSEGNLIWAKQIGPGNCWANYILLDTSGNIYITGDFRSTVDFDPGSNVYNLTSFDYTGNVFVSKYDSSGNFIWAKNFDAGTSVASSSGFRLAIDKKGNVYTGGYYFDTCDFNPGPGVYKLISNGGNDIFISKLDSSGNFIWAKSFGGLSDDYLFGMSLDISGNVYTAGSFADTIDSSPDAHINKLDSAGNLVWSKNINCTGASGINSMVIDKDKIYTSGSFTDTAYFLIGSNMNTFISAGSYDVFTCALDTASNFIWAKSSGGTGDDSNYSMALDSSGNVYTIGGSDVYLSKFDNSGNLFWAKPIETGFAIGQSIAVDNFNNIYVGGIFQGTCDFGGINLIATPAPADYPVSTSDLFILKLTQSGGVLPIQLSDLRAYQKNDDVVVEWTVQQENNVIEYEVQRSQDGLHFSNIGIVKAKANNNFTSTYNLIDSNFFDGINFYRIKIIDNDNSFTYSQIVKLNVSDKAGELKIYPNPITNNQFTLEMNNLPIGTYTITLYNKLGQEIISKLLLYQGGISKEVINIPKTLSSGVYQLKIKSKDSNFIKQLIKK